MHFWDWSAFPARPVSEEIAELDELCGDRLMINALKAAEKRGAGFPSRAPRLTVGAQVLWTACSQAPHGPATPDLVGVELAASRP